MCDLPASVCEIGFAGRSFGVRPGEPAMSTSTRVKPRRSAPAASAFGVIRARAVKRKGGERVLQSLLPPVARADTLAALGDDRVLAEMTKRIFSAGFVWSVIEKKWPGFEAAFLGFAPKRLLAQPDEFWERLASDSRIVRNGPKIMAVRANAKFIAEIAAAHRSEERRGGKEGRAR